MLQALDRRLFVKGAVAALGLAPGLPAARTGMYLSLNGSLTGGKQGWPDFARLAARLGYGGVDVNLGAAMKEGVDSTRALFAELKIKPAVVGLPLQVRGDEAAFQTGLQRLDEVAKFAAAIDCARMTTVMPASSDTPKSELRKMYKDRLTAIGEILQRSKVRLGLEFLGPLQLRSRQPHEFIWRMSEMLEFAKECGPSIGLLLDSWHWYHAGATVADILAAGQSRIVHVHVSDCIRQAPEDVRDNQRVMPGEGVIDLVAFFKALQKTGYVDGVSPEVLGRIPKDTPAEEGAKLGLDTTRAVMRKAGVV
ncbi:MAG: sugar phosphate isomerase/epimerase [Acidobacteria bacterium]|nr:sugar phosphate isomerase/epimerase [Acidobacteriota bacterium]